MKVIRVLIFPKTKSLDFGLHGDGYEILMPWLRLDMALSDVDDFLKQKLFFYAKTQFISKNFADFSFERNIFFGFNCSDRTTKKTYFFDRTKKTFQSRIKLIEVDSVLSNYVWRIYDELWILSMYCSQVLLGFKPCQLAVNTHVFRMHCIFEVVTGTNVSA